MGRSESVSNKCTKGNLTHLEQELVCLGVLRTPKQTNNHSELRNS